MSQAAFTFPIRVYIEDTDAGGIVYHANHIKFMERTRTEWLRALGFEHYLMDFLNPALPERTAFVVHELSIRYHKPARVNDLLTVSVLPLHCKAASFALQQTIAIDGTLIASATVWIACVDQHLKTCLIPQHIRDVLQGYLSAVPLA